MADSKTLSTHLFRKVDDIKLNSSTGDLSLTIEKTISEEEWTGMIFSPYDFTYIFTDKTFTSYGNFNPLAYYAADMGLTADEYVEFLADAVDSGFYAIEDIVEQYGSNAWHYTGETISYNNIDYGIWECSGTQALLPINTKKSSLIQLSLYQNMDNRYCPFTFLNPYDGFYPNGLPSGETNATHYTLTYVK